jgi:hypothetical protein
MDEDARPKESFEDLMMRFDDVRDAMDIIARQLSTKGAVTLKDFEVLKQPDEQKFLQS